MILKRTAIWHTPQGGADKLLARRVHAEEGIIIEMNGYLITVQEYDDDASLILTVAPNRKRGNAKMAAEIISVNSIQHVGKFYLVDEQGLQRRSLLRPLSVVEGRDA